MNFLIRPAKEEDLSSIFDLARQFSLLNLPADKRVLMNKIEASVDSFSGELPFEKCQYLFVAEDLENGNVAGCSGVKAKHGTAENPTYSFKIIKKERFSRDLGIGFIHQILRLNICTDGPTEIGGLVVDKAYRRRPEKVGRQTSLMRFMYIGMNQEKFSKELHSEMAPPLTEEGRSEFWEALGRRFTGMPYQEADALSTQNKEFIRSLFPEEDIYLCLLDSRARLVIGRVGPDTQPAMHMLERLGFTYKDEVDPFDGGPHLGVETSKVALVKNAAWRNVANNSKASFGGNCFVSVEKDKQFRGGTTPFEISGDEIILPEITRRTLGVEIGEKVYCSVYE